MTVNSLGVRQKEGSLGFTNCHAVLGLKVSSDGSDALSRVYMYEINAVISGQINAGGEWFLGLSNVDFLQI